MHAKAAKTGSCSFVVTKLLAKAAEGGLFESLLISRWPSVAPPPFHSNLLRWPARLLWRMIQFLAVLFPPRTNGRKVHLGPADPAGSEEREDEGR